MLNQLKTDHLKIRLALPEEGTQFAQVIANARNARQNWEERPRNFDAEFSQTLGPIYQHDIARGYGAFYFAELTDYWHEQPPETVYAGPRQMGFPLIGAMILCTGDKYRDRMEIDYIAAVKSPYPAGGTLLQLALLSAMEENCSSLTLTATNACNAKWFQENAAFTQGRMKSQLVLKKEDFLPSLERLETKYGLNNALRA